ncbi:hypothetical protein SLEP1_g58551 [Rubroshorea leprosula]|uniref:Uncharacterized protein n=1 Tax=Rubroshorea leprosula TaxID=152421 RepID=A0AAV5MPN0_9ROSI|nr:hypothetical protein SLEP1_g58551 [Rubroshorea leprosula]
MKISFLKLASCSQEVSYSRKRYSFSGKQSRRPKESRENKGFQARQYLIIL